jgi:putative phage-type endonuclease
MNIYTAIDKVKRLLEKRVIFTLSQRKELNQNISQLFQEYISINASMMHSPNFDKNLTDYIYTNMAKQIVHLYSENSQYRVCKKLQLQINRTKKSLYPKLIPPRSYSTSFVRNIKFNIAHLTDKITTLQELPQPSQRTEEWYQFRHNLLTASSIWKVFGTQSCINQLIYEKCEPYLVHKQASIDSPLHWGQKYEPVSAELYSNLYNTTVADFGCIKHQTYPFIGASPDGINVSINNPRYGRMLEIKNIVNRIITGIPKLEYWIQMQLQMETCNLNECDFLETKFVEYDSYNDFIQDGNFTHTDDGKYKGIMILFNYAGVLHYEYAPFQIAEKDYDSWEEEIIRKNASGEWIRTIYWRLEQYSNILVLRNKIWFDAAILKIKEIWDIILKERVEGHSHRAPKRRKSVGEFGSNKCLIKVEKL